jgi:hypothetical protein
MVWQVVKSDAFLKRRAPEPKQVVAQAADSTASGVDTTEAAASKFAAQGGAAR